VVVTDEPRKSSTRDQAPAVKAQIEREVKFHVSRAFVVPPLGDDEHRDLIGSTLRHDTVYWDTADLRLARHGHTLRYRERGDDGGSWTLKLGQDSDGEMLCRREVERAGDPDEPPRELVHAVVALTRGRPLVAVARLHTDEQQYAVLAGDGERVLAIEDDRVAVVDDAREMGSFRELEVEVANDDGASVLAAAIEQLRRAGAGDPDPVPKLVRVLGPVASRVAVPDLTRSATVEEVVRVAVLDGLDQLLTHDPGVRLDLDPEDVHRSRVAMRRLRANLRTLRPILDRRSVDVLRDEIRWAGTQLGAVRDLDVLDRAFTSELHDRQSRECDELLRVLRMERASARGRLLDAMNSERWQTMMQSLDAAARLPPLRGTITPTARARKSAPAMLRKSWRRLARRVAAAEAGSTSFHEVRKAAKSTRYAAELLAPLLGAEARALARAAEDIQTELGDQQDGVVACEWLRRHVTDVEFGSLADDLCRAFDRGPIRQPDRWRRMWKRARRAAAFVD
jgi:CHAD domain-containing protein